MSDSQLNIIDGKRNGKGTWVEANGSKQERDYKNDKWFLQDHLD